MSNELTTRQMLDAVTQSAYLFYVSTHYPRLNMKAKDIEVKIDGHELQEHHITPPQWKLMPDEFKSRLSEISRSVTACMDRYKIPVRSTATRSLLGDRELGDDYDPDRPRANRVLHVRGLCLIPESRVEACVAELEELNRRLHSTVEEMVGNIEEFRADVRTQIDDEVVWDEVKDRLPSAAQMRANTGIEWVPFPIGTTNAAVTRANDNEIRTVIRERKDQMIAGLLESIVEEPRQELHATLSDLDKLIQRDGRVSTRSFEPVFRALEKLRSFGITDDELDTRINHLQDRMAVVVPSEQNSNTASSNGLTAAIRGVMAQATDEAAIIESWGLRARGIHFDAELEFQDEESEG